MYSTAAQAMDRPSKVDVPRPTSSSINRLLGVANLRMVAISLISTMKVDCPPYRSSDAPMRVKMRSVSAMSAASVGTKDPMWAISTISATCRM